MNVHVRKGESGSSVVLASKTTRTVTDEATGDETEQGIPFLKGYTAFNVEQVEGLPSRGAGAETQAGYAPDIFATALIAGCVGSVLSGQLQQIR